MLNQHLVFEPGAGGLTGEECDEVRSIVARLRSSAKPGGVGGGAVRREVRRAQVAWVNMADDTAWLFSRVFSLAHAANVASGWNFELIGPNPSLQLSVYEDAELGTFDWHADIGEEQASFRKVSVVIEIESAQEGGVLQFHPGQSVRSVRSGPGTAVVFPSYLSHRLSPVTEGRRVSLVAWVCGPQFR